jgi:predicted peroxiredoxin
VAKILVHLTHGPEHPTRAALALLVARSAVAEGHTVSLFLAGDAVQLVRPAVLDNLVGLGTGRLREHYDTLVGAGCKFYLSGMSCKSRGVALEDVDSGSAGTARPQLEMAMPEALVRLSLEHDRMFTY